jgi:hypothetical protein
MPSSFRRLLCAGIVPLLGMLSGMACRRPETALRERPAQRIELVQKVQGMTPEEGQALVAQLEEGLGIPAASAAPAAGPIRALRLTLKGGPDADASRGPGRTWAVTVGEGFLSGVLLASGAVAYTFTSWEATAIGGGVGAILGAAYGPVRYRKNQALQRELGYLPWRITADWEVLDRSPGRSEEVAARDRTIHLEPGPFLRPLPPGARTEGDVRQASLRATAQALLQRLRERKALPAARAEAPR